MKYRPIDLVIGQHTYIVGYYYEKDGIDLPDFIEYETKWYDDYGNPKWELLPDGAVTSANLTPTSDQLAKKQDDDRIDRATTILVKTIVQAIRSTSTPAESWKAIDAALRAIL